MSSTSVSRLGLHFEEMCLVLTSGSGVGRVVFQTEAPLQQSLSLNATDYKGAKLRVEQHR